MPQDLPGDEKGAIAALLTGGNPRGLRNAGIVIDAASRRPERLKELVQCVFSADEVVRMRASDALEMITPRLTRAASSTSLARVTASRPRSRMQRGYLGRAPDDRVHRFAVKTRACGTISLRRP